MKGANAKHFRPALEKTDRTVFDVCSVIIPWRLN